MTTSWSHMMRGQLARALAANVGGAMLGACAVALAPWCLVSAIRGTWPVRPPSDRVLATIAVTIAIVTLIDWSLRVALG